MRPAGATFWRLGGGSGWQSRTASADLAVSDRQGLRLAAAEGGPLSLSSPDGSFGGLTSPRGLAMPYRLREGVIERYDRESRTFVEFARAEGATSIAIARNWLYVTVPYEKQVRILDLVRGVLLDVLERDDWFPLDVFTHKGAAFILDQKHGRVYRHAPYGCLEIEFERKDREHCWTRLLLDREGTLYLLNGNYLERRDGALITDPGAIRDRFDAPVIQPPPSCPAPDESAPAANGDYLRYVVRRAEKRVEAYTDDGRRLRHSFGAGRDWQPVDVAACGNAAFILDEQHQTVLRHHGGREQLKEIIRGEQHWTRIACDAQFLYLWTPGADCVQRFDCSGNPRGERPYKDVRTLFETKRPAAQQPVATPEPSDVRHYQSTGQWQSAPLDSRKYRCQWHRIQLELSQFPPGTRLSVSTCAHENADDVHDALRAQWVDAQTIVAPIENPPKSFDFLVQSGAGRYLSLRIRLHGDGYATPAVDSMKVHYPRESYLEHLPATYSADDEMRVFLERFLSIFQTEWDDLDRRIDEIEALFDPNAVPDGPMLEHLAKQWLGLQLEGDWDWTQKRRLLTAVPKIYPHRGQLQGLRDYVAVYLANFAGLETKDVQQLELPVIVEGFRERETLFAKAPLWSASVTRRLQLGVYATEGEVAMVSIGDPGRDVFTEYAHKFRVYVPAAWVRNETNERMLRRAIESEKPSHTQYELCLVEPRLRVGAQSTIGIDTVIGAEPSLTLGCPCCSSDAPSLPPAGRLGYDTVLSTDARAVADLVLA